MRFLTTVSFFDDIQKFIYYAEYYSNRTSKQPIWFISTDSPSVEDMFKKRYKDRIFTLDSLPMRHTKTLAYNYYDPAVQRAILDNYLLSRSNLLITTAWSSFGEMAVGRMDSGSTILITRSDPIKDPPPLVTINHTSLSWNCLLKICIYEIFWIFRCPPKHLLI